MPSARKGRPAISFDAIEEAHEVVRPVQDRIAYQIELERIETSPHNPRHKLDGLDELAASLQQYGLLQPVVVRRVNRAYELIAGHRRLAAAKQLGWAQIAAVVRDEPDDQAYLLTLTENLQREDLTPKEEAAALEVLVRERGWTTRQVGEAIKRSHIYVSRRLRVFEDAVLAGPVLANALPVSTAEELLRAEPDVRAELADRAVAAKWGQADARRAVLERNVPNHGWTELTRHLKAAVDAAAQVDPATLSPADRKLVRRALAALRGLTRTSR